MRYWLIVGAMLALALFAFQGNPSLAISGIRADHSHEGGSVINHAGPTDRNGCHRDGKGGYHCH